MKNFLLKTTLVAFFVSTLTITNAQNANQKTELKPVPIENTNSQKYRTQTQPLITASNNKTSKNGGIRGNDILGEGQYLHFDKKIMSHSVSGEIPVGFPKHIIGQSKEEYVKIMEDWALAHPEKFIEPGEYLNYKEKIKERSINGQIPEGFPKYIKGQTRAEYIQIMKEWGIKNLDKFKEEYRSPKQ